MTTLPIAAEMSEGERLSFLWSQHSYVTDYIKFADAKAALIASGTTAIIGAAYGGKLRSSTLSVRSLQGLHAYLTVIAFVLLAASVVFAAWSIKPRLLTGSRLRPMSWVDIANYRDAESFERAHSNTNAEEFSTMLAHQVYYMSRICKRKHLFVAISLLFCIAGAGLTVLLGFSV
jgi:hypothetical protein